MAKSERVTEQIVFDFFKKAGEAGLLIDPQKSADPDIIECLKAAGKKGNGGPGRPEFLIHHPSRPDFLVVIECKADQSKHESKQRDPASDAFADDFAVDGAIRYARFLKNKFDVVAVAVSGDREDRLLISTFRWLKKEADYRELADRNGHPVRAMVSFEDFYRLLTFDPKVHKRTSDDLHRLGRDLHEFFRNYAKLDDKQKPLLVSGILLALQDGVFSRSYSGYDLPDLPRELRAAILRHLKKTQIDRSKMDALDTAYGFIETEAALSAQIPGTSTSPLRHIIGLIDEHVRPYSNDYQSIDAIGRFYGEFLRYRAEDRKNKGIVLTPKHVTDLFVKLAAVGPNDTVLDTCAGTGGFLIAALAEMDEKAGVNQALRDEIRTRRLIGVEQDSSMFALAASNMILRGDGKSNLYYGSCFDDEIKRQIREVSAAHDRPTVGLINPPYRQDKGEGNSKIKAPSGPHEFEFIETMLDSLAPNGIGIAIVPMRCAVGLSDKSALVLRRSILSKHRLDAVMSMPNDLFDGAGTHTCIMVFRAQRSHSADHETWFAYWKDDGFVRVRSKGRRDEHQRWKKIETDWIKAYITREVIADHSVLKAVSAEDEWCAEAYMETSKEAMASADFGGVVRRFVVFDMARELVAMGSPTPDEAAA